MKVDSSQSNALYRSFTSTLDVVTAVDKFRIIAGGHELIDLSCGPTTTCLGLNNPEVINVIREQQARIPYAFSGFWASEVVERLADMVRNEFEKTWPGWFGKALFLSAGGEAVDLACKLASQYWREQGVERFVFGAREFAFHGIGMFTSALSGDYLRYQPMSFLHSKIQEHYVVRLPGYLVERDEKQLLIDTERILLTTTLAAVVIEPVGGPPVGCMMSSRAYIGELKKLCVKNDTLLLCDEVLCGTGRTGYMSAMQYYQTPPDIIVLGKGISSGYVPLSAIVISKKVSDCLTRGSGTLMFGTTYTNHTTACAAGAAALGYMQDHHLFELVQKRTDLLTEILERHLRHIPIVRGIYGTGYLRGIELARPNGSPFPAVEQFHLKVRKKAYECGVIVYSKGQTVYGERDFIVIAPPFEMQPEVIEQAVRKVAYAISTQVQKVNE